MGAKHTQGPWVIKFRNDHSAYISLGVPCIEHKQFDIGFDDRYPSDVADARLIAAAPELLEALRGLLEGSRYLGNGRWNLIKSPSDEAMTRAADAIAKATGEAA